MTILVTGWLMFFFELHFGNCIYTDSYRLARILKFTKMRGDMPDSFQRVDESFLECFHFCFTNTFVTSPFTCLWWKSDWQSSHEAKRWQAGCIPVVVRDWGGEGEALAKLQVGRPSGEFQRRTPIMTGTCRFIWWWLKHLSFSKGEFIWKCWVFSSPCRFTWEDTDVGFSSTS